MAPADAALAVGYPGDHGARQPVHTVYVPADRVTADLVADYGKAALATLVGHGPQALAAIVGADRAPDDRGLVAAAGQALERAGRGPADRPGGRLPRPFRRRGGRRRCRVRSGPSRLLPRRTGGCGSSPSRPPPEPAGCARSTWCSALPWRPVRSRTGSGSRFRRSPRSPRSARWWRPVAGWRRRTGWTTVGCPSRSRSRRPRSSWDPTGPRPSPGSSTRPQVAATGCTSAPTTTRPRSGSPPASRRWTIRSPTMPRT